MTIRNAQHARLRTVAPTTNYATATETVWDGNSPCSASGEQAFLSAHVVGSAFSAAAPNGLIRCRSAPVLTRVYAVRRKSSSRT
jgi:hypothetical protein